MLYRNKKRLDPNANLSPIFIPQKLFRFLEPAAPDLNGLNRSSEFFCKLTIIGPVRSDNPHAVLDRPFLFFIKWIFLAASVIPFFGTIEPVSVCTSPIIRRHHSSFPPSQIAARIVTIDARAVK